MPTNKLWLEHTERAAWDSVEALRERLAKAEARVQSLLAGAPRVPELLDALEQAKLKYAPQADGLDAVVRELLALLERQEGELQRAKAPGPTVVSFAAPPPRPPLDSEDLEQPLRGAPEDEDFELSGFTNAMRRHSRTLEPVRDWERLLALAETKLDDLNELEGGPLREAAVELAILAGRIYAASRSAP
jgi:hypothetical protein